ncbi:MAG: 2-dehydropantoate 2-reductase [Xanthobacteraceae bacterium]
MVSARPIIIAGAGSIGCFVGGMLAGGGRPVGLLARPRVVAEIERHDLRISSFEGADRRIPASQLILANDAAVLAEAVIVLVTVKSADTAAMADEIARHAPADAVVVSLQNGIGNVAILREHLPGRQVLSGMVPFNVIALGEGRYHRATSGDIVIDRDQADTAARLLVDGLTVRASDNMPGVQWGKLLLNLNNALNALSGLPLREQLAQRPWRRLLADHMSEALRAMRAEGISPVASTGVPPALTPYLLRLPDVLFQIVTRRSMQIDPMARSSMWEDLQHRRRTEIDYLQGVIVALAKRHRIDVPLTRRIVDLVKTAEQAGKGSPGLSAAQVRG